MNEISTIGLDLAKNVFQAHGADATGAVVFRKQLRRDKVLAFFAGQPACLVAMEACSGAHYWAREIGKLGHTVRLIPPPYVKPFVKRQKNDMADAEAISEAAQRPTMRFVPVKSEEQQASAVAFRTRDLLVRQRTQAINALRGHLAEYGLTVAKGAAHVAALVRWAQDPRAGVPTEARFALDLLVQTLTMLEAQIKQLDEEITRRARKAQDARRLMTIPGVGPMTATALLALAPGAASFRCGRDFAAWLGLTPLQRSTGGKQKLGATSKMGERTLRRLLIIGATAVVRHARRVPPSPGSWLGRMIGRKPPMLIAVALANKMARTVWALMARGGVYQAPAVAA